MKSFGLFVLFFLTLAAGARWQVAAVHREQAEAALRVMSSGQMPVMAASVKNIGEGIGEGRLQTVSFTPR